MYFINFETEIFKLILNFHLILGHALDLETEERDRVVKTVVDAHVPALGMTTCKIWFKNAFYLQLPHWFQISG